MEGFTSAPLSEFPEEAHEEVAAWACGPSSYAPPNSISEFIWSG